MKDPLYDLLELVERLESLREDMIELGVTTLAEVEERLAQLHHEIDALPEGDEA